MQLVADEMNKGVTVHQVNGVEVKKNRWEFRTAAKCNPSPPPCRGPSPRQESDRVPTAVIAGRFG